MVPERSVVVLATTLPARPGDGTPQFVLDLSLRLARTYTVEIVAPRVPGGARHERMGNLTIRRFAYFPQRWEALADGAIMPNLRARPILALQIPTLLLAFLAATMVAVVRRRPAVLHAHWIVPGGLIAAIVGRLWSIPYVVTAHGADGFALRGKVARRVKQWVLSRAAAVLPVSRDLAQALGLAVTSTTVVPMGTDLSAMSAGPRPDPAPGRLLFIGRLAAKKGVDVLLHALADVPQADLVVVGDGPDAAALRDLSAQLGLEERVTFAGRLPRDSVAQQLRRAAVLVIPSRTADDGDRDGMPLVLPEGMSAGVPVVASRLGGLAEYVEDERTGLLVEPDDPVALAAAVRRLLDDPALRDRLATTAQQSLTGSPLDLDATAARYRDAIEQAARVS